MNFCKVQCLQLLKVLGLNDCTFFLKPLSLAGRTGLRKNPNKEVNHTQTSPVNLCIKITI